MSDHYRTFLLFICTLSVYFNHAKADTPANCSYEDVRGSWKLYEFVKGQDKTIDCTYNSK